MRVKKIICTAFAFLIATTPVFAGGADDYGDDLATAAPVTAAKSSILIDAVSGNVLCEDNADEPMPPASITKIMTLLLTMEALEAGKFTLDTIVTCSEEASSMGGSEIWLKPGEEMSVNDLLKATCISSANDAAYALGELVSGSRDAFVSEMNEKAKVLRMKNTVFMNPHGLDAEGHVSTARDIAIMSRELMSHKLIKNYTTVWMDTLRDGSTQLVNTNKLIRFYKGATGLKTGTTNGAGSCLSASAERDGVSLIAVVMGCTTSAERFASAKTLLDYGFANYSSFTPDEPKELKGTVRVNGGAEETVSLSMQKLTPLMIMKGDKEKITVETKVVSEVTAPVIKGDKMGEMIVRNGNKIIARYQITAASSVRKRTFFDTFRLLLSSFFS